MIGGVQLIQLPCRSIKVNRLGNRIAIEYQNKGNILRQQENKYNQTCVGGEGGETELRDRAMRID